MKKSRDVKTVIILLSVMAVIVLAYLAQDVYFRWSGNLKTEYLFMTTERETVVVDGFVVRDENRTEDGVGVSLLRVQSDRTYLPAVSDSTSVAANDTIAYAFKSEKQAQMYQRHLELEEKIQNLQNLQSQGGQNYIDVVALNSEILSSVNRYMKLIDSNRLSDLKDVTQTLTYQITTKQIATGATLDFSVRLDQLEAEKAQLEANMKEPQRVTTPYAGYFVSGADGYENAFDYASLQKESVTPEQVDDLMNAKPSNTTGVFGKIIGQHTWYYLCNVSISKLSNLRKGYYVTVSFPEHGVYDVSMRVQSVSERFGDKVALVLKCTSMNESLSVLRRERAEITVNRHEGYKISSEALRENDDGLTGVFVLSGKVVTFKPIKILYHGPNYVVAAPAVYYLENGEIDTERTPDLPRLETFDQVIVKGKSLYDGKVIG